MSIKSHYCCLICSIYVLLGHTLVHGVPIHCVELHLSSLDPIASCTTDPSGAISRLLKSDSGSSSTVSMFFDIVFSSFSYCHVVQDNAGV